jgi:very-short-patch-repair endonuclease
MANIYNGQLKEHARLLRKSMTKQEVILWNHLRRKQILDIKFLRQKPSGQYILDFYAPQIKLAIELDGSQHYEANSNDHLRDEALARNGIMVVRYSNNDINFNLKSVLEDIYIKIQVRIDHIKLDCANL